MDTITRKEAKSRGLSYYFTGRPCKHGHISKRLVDSGVCYQCSLDFKKTSKGKQSYREYRKKYSNIVNERALQYWHSKLNKKVQHTRLTNPLVGYRHQRKWEKLNPGKKRAIDSKRRAMKLQATPPWFIDERHQINQLYILSHRLTKETGILYTVDHIIPLQHPLVCGLHCLSNLRVITGAENFSKGNKLLDI